MRSPCGPYTVQVRVVILDEAESLLSSRELNGSSAKHYNSSVTQVHAHARHRRDACAA